MTRQDVDSWLRKEAEKLTEEYYKVESEITKKANSGKFDDIYKLQIKRRELLAQEVKLYEMIGRTNDLEN